MYCECAVCFQYKLQLNNPILLVENNNYHDDREKTSMGGGLYLATVKLVHERQLSYFKRFLQRMFLSDGCIAMT